MDLPEFYMGKAYDGTPLYEYPNRDVGESKWGSCNLRTDQADAR